ncbi:MAG: WD40 repeat domain-containing protein [Chloroflexi bacterium]|nr:WD40 repeat domain-containing protein [Chloroflexota bacterium]
MDEEYINELFAISEEYDQHRDFFGRDEGIVKVRGFYNFLIRKQNQYIQRYGRGPIHQIIPIAEGIFIAISGGSTSLHMIGYKSPLWEIDIPAACGAVSSKHNQLALAWSKRIYVFTLENEVSQMELLGPKRRILSLDFSWDGKYLAAGGFDNVIYLWDRDKGKTPTTLNGQTNMTNCVSFSPKGKLLATIGDDSTIQIWDYEKEILLQLIEHPDSFHFNSLQFWYDGGAIVVSSLEGELFIIDPNTGEISFMYKDTDPLFPIIPLTAFRLCKTTQYLALSGGNSRKIKLLDLFTQSEYELFGHNNILTDLQFDPAGSLMYSSSLDGSIKVWDLLDKSETLNWDAWNGGVNSLSISADSTKLAASSSDHKIRIWDAKSGNLLKLLDLEGKVDLNVSHVRFLSNTRLLIIGMNIALQWNFEKEDSNSLDACTGYRISPGLVSSVEINNNKDRLFICGWNLEYPNNHVVSAHNIEDGSLIWKNEYHVMIKDVKLFDNNQFLIYGGNGEEIYVVDSLSGRVVNSIATPDSYTSSISINPKNHILASAGADGAIRFWNLDDLKLVDQIGPFNSSFRSVSFSPDGEYCAFGNNDGQIGIRNLHIDKRLNVIQVCSSPITSISFSPDGQYLFTGSRDGTVHSWDYKLHFVGKNQ